MLRRRSSRLSASISIYVTPYVVILVDDPVSFTYELPKPRSWTDPADGTVYTKN